MIWRKLQLCFDLLLLMRRSRYFLMHNIPFLLAERLSHQEKTEWDSYYWEAPKRTQMFGEFT